MSFKAAEARLRIPDSLNRLCILGPCNSRSTITRSRSKKNTITDQIANCRNEPLSANHGLKKNLQFLKKNYTLSRDRELQKWATFCKSRSHEKLYHFSRKATQFLVIANCRNGLLSANYDPKKNKRSERPERPYPALHYSEKG